MYEQLKAIMVEVLLLDAEGVRPDASREAAGLDSLAVVELSMVLSQRLGIDISDDELLELNTVADIAALMQMRTPVSEASR
jgi:acyl carrier protein